MLRSIYNVVFFPIIAVISFMGLSACDQSQNQFTEALDIHKPYGLAWDSSKFHANASKQKCLKQIKVINTLLTEAEADILLEACLSEQHETVFLLTNEITPQFQKGEIGALIIGENKPIMFTYSYLHELFPTKESMKKKLLHATELKKNLKKLYGAPTTRGYYDEGSEFGFVIRKFGKKPCDFWIEQNIGILLCSERVIYMDGFEMSLSFIKLDDNLYGKALREMILSKGNQDAKILNSQANQDTQNKKMSPYGAMYVLNEWLAKPLDSCLSKGLEPLEKAWEPSVESKKALSSILENYKGEALAEYAFDVASNYPKKISKQERDKVTLYLLKHAAEQGSVSAMNEIGVSLLDCSLNVQQDLLSAKIWFDKAIKGGDLYASYNRARMYLLYESDVIEPRQKAIGLLAPLAKKDFETYGDDFIALQLIANLKTN